MSRIDDLIAEHCPDGVEFRALKDVALFQRGSAMTIRSAVPGEYRLVANSPEPIGTHNESNREGEFVVVARSGAGAGTVSLWEGPLFLTDAFSVHPHQDKLTTRFVFYLLQSQQSALREMKAGGGVPHVRVKEVETYKIPVPPLAVQREIASILDKMESLKGELEVELEYRSRQYAFYRQVILEQVAAETVALSSLGKWQGGITPSKSNPAYWEAGTIPWLASMDVSDTSTDGIRGRVTEKALNETSLKVVPGPSVAVVMRSNILRRTLPIGLIKVDTTLNQDMRALVPRDGVDAEYVFQALRADGERIRSACVRTDGSMAAVDSQSLFSWEIPLPTIEEQRSIAERLRHFDDLVSNLSVGLPAEIAARRTQYEYYRDKLLTFKAAA